MNETKTFRIIHPVVTKILTKLERKILSSLRKKAVSTLFTAQFGSRVIETTFKRRFEDCSCSLSDLHYEKRKVIMFQNLRQEKDGVEYCGIHDRVTRLNMMFFEIVTLVNIMLLGQ